MNYFLARGLAFGPFTWLGGCGDDEPHPVEAAGWSLGPRIVPSARLVKVSLGAVAALETWPWGWLAVRNGAGFTFCDTAAPLP